MRQDLLEKAKGFAKNSLEEYVYDMRDKLSDSLRPYIAEKVRNVVAMHPRRNFGVLHLRN